LVYRRGCSALPAGISQNEGETSVRWMERVMWEREMDGEERRREREKWKKG
jgi:hypothetical protein